MSKALLAQGRFVIILKGRQAGKKAIVLSVSESGTNERKYDHALVLGIEKAPKKLTKGMPQETLVKHTKVKTFIKTINVNHLLITRHSVKADDDLWNKVKVADIANSLNDPEQKKKIRDTQNEVFRQKFLNNKLTWLFKPLHF